MMRRGFQSVLLVALVLGLVGASHAAERVALVIGNGGYSRSPLKNPVRDAKAVGDALKSLGFSVIREFNTDKRSMISALRRFGRECAGAEVALFYYAGHGMQVGGVNYLIPVKADIRQEQDVEFEAVDVNRFLTTLEKARAGLNIVILDACRDNPFSSFRSASRGLAVVRGISESIVVYATAPGDVAADGGGVHSPFTAALLKEIKKPVVEVKSLFDVVGYTVSESSSGRQRPWISSSFYRQCYLRGHGEQAKVAATAPAPAIQVTMARVPKQPPRAASGHFKGNTRVASNMILRAPADQRMTKAPVSFPHGKHEGSVDCMVCHHKGVSKGCTSNGCHTDNSKAAKRDPAGFYQAFHARAENSCVGCHKVMKKNGKTVPLTCKRCHPRKR